MSQPSLRVAVQKLARASGGMVKPAQRSQSVIVSTAVGVSGAHSHSHTHTSHSCVLTTAAHSQTQRHIHSASGGKLGSRSDRNVVSVSSILLQDGLAIQELPILVRLLDKGMVPLANHTFSGEMIQPMTAADEKFQHLLQDCASVRDVFKLLEIPSERVTGYSASAALQRVCELQKMNKDWDDLHSFIRTAVMKELSDTVRRDVSQLSNDTLVSLVSCYMGMERNANNCLSVINREIEARIAEEQFEIEELCALSQRLHTSEKGDKDLMNIIWVYIGNHYRDVGERSLATVLSSLPPSHKYLLKVLGHQLHKFWWKMKAEDTVSCLASLVQHNSLQASMLSDLARWLFLNVHEVSQSGLMQFVAAFIHFRFSDSHFTTALERHVGAKGDNLDTNLLGLVMEYCRSRRFFSPVVMETAAAHFVQHGRDYSALQMFTVLRPFGQLNFMPPRCHEFLFQIEKRLEERFSDFLPEHLAELLCSFAFVEKVPLNFVQKVMTPSFFSKVKDLPRDTGLWLEMLQSAVKLDARGVRIPCLYKIQPGKVWKDDRMRVLQSRLQETLTPALGNSCVKMNSYAANTIYSIDAEIHLTKDRQPIPVNYHGGQPSSQVAVRLAILIMAADHYCVNSGHLLGEFSMRRRHLRKLGYTVVEVFDTEILSMNRSERLSHLADKLKKWVDLKDVDWTHDPSD